MRKPKDYSYNAMRAAQAQAGTNLKDETGAKLHEPAMMLALGLRPGQHLPPAGLPSRMIGNVNVWVEPAHPVAPGGIDSRRRRTARHRIWCTCPDCGHNVSAGRLHQHQGTLTCMRNLANV